MLTAEIMTGRAGARRIVDEDAIGVASTKTMTKAGKQTKFEMRTEAAV